MKTSAFTYKILLFTLFSFFSFYSQAQTQWSTFAEVDGVKIEYAEIECREEGIPPQLAVILKFTNTNNKTISVDWDLKIWYNDKEVSENIADNENHFTLTLQPNQSVMGDCAVPFGALYIYKDFLIYEAKQKLTKFELINIRITQ